MAVEGGFAQGPGLGKARLTYFRGWGLAEQVRWVLSAAGAEWEQVGLETNEQFEALKKGGRLLFGQLPLLEIDGLELVQSQAMVRHVARRAGLSGKTPAEEVRAPFRACRPRTSPASRRGRHDDGVARLADVAVDSDLPPSDSPPKKSTR